MDNFETLVVQTVDWQPLKNFMSRTSKKTIENTAKYGSCGVYLIASKCDGKELPNNIIDKNIGYVGKSGNIFARIYDIRGGEHGARKYIASKNIDVGDVYVKILTTEPGNETDLERIIHDKNTEAFGNRFAWKEASSGNDGNLLKALDIIEKINDLEALRDIVTAIEDKASNILLENWKNGD
jgi:hypothetical protein